MSGRTIARRRHQLRLRRELRADTSAWFERMINVYAIMNDETREELHRWEDEHCGALGTSDWPGWQLLMGPKP